MKDRAWLRPLVRDMVLAVVIVLGILGSLYLYSGSWPPMVVIESGSMQHSHDESSVGIIDTGDLTVVRNTDREDDIVTWVEGRVSGHSTYGDHGDVIVFYKNGARDTTPVIHRALVWIEFNNTTGDSFDVPSLGLFDAQRLVLDNLTTYDSGKRVVRDLEIDLQLVLSNFDGAKAPHGGYLTKGDHNPHIDQISLYIEGRPEGESRRTEPIMDEWIVGVSKGELPWFGAIKLMFSEEAGSVPRNSVQNLIITCCLLVVVPALVDVLWVAGIPEVRRRIGLLRRPADGKGAEGSEQEEGSTDSGTPGAP
jgi:signal peptidase